MYSADFLIEQERPVDQLVLRGARPHISDEPVVEPQLPGAIAELDVRA